MRHYKNVRIDHNADAESLRRMEEEISSIKDLIYKKMLKWVGNQDSNRFYSTCAWKLENLHLISCDRDDEAKQYLCQE